MSFPTTSALDDFTRADANPISGDWAGPIWAGDSQLEIVSDQATLPADGAYHEDYWTGSEFSRPCEVWFTVSGWPGGDWGPGAYLCLTGEGTDSPSGYFLWCENEDEIHFGRTDSGSYADLIDVTGLTLGDGDGVGVSITAEGIVTVYHAPGGTGWTQIGTTTDTTYASGKLGLQGSGPVDSTPGGFTSFGGGVSTDSGGGGGAGGNVPMPPPNTPRLGRGINLTVCGLDGLPVDGAHVGHALPVRTPQQPQVTIPLSDSRTGQVAVSMYEPIAGPIATGAATTVIKCLYVNPKGDTVLLLNGINMNPESDFDAGIVTVQLHDSTIRLKKRNLGYSHYSIMLGLYETISDGDVNELTGGDFNGMESVYGIPLDGTGLRLMLLDASHGAQDWRGWPLDTSSPFHSVPAMGIRYTPGVNSVDDANRQPLYGSDGVPPQGFAFTATVTEGDATLTDVVLPSGYTISDVYEYGALAGDGIPEYAQVVSATGTTVTMSVEATSGGGADTTVVLEDAIYCQLSRGDGVYDDITDIVNAQGAFESNWVPVDADNLGPSGATWYPGQLCELYTANRVGSDRSQGNADGNVPVVFVEGIGGFHLTYSPDADSLVTYVVECGPGGPADPNDVLNKVTFESDSVGEYGFWEDWEQATSAGTGDNPISNSVLANRAAAVLTAYQAVPQFITATIDSDLVSRYAYGTDFFLGDTVTVYAKKGYVSVGPLTVRITEIGVTQVDENGNCQLSLTLVPYLTANPGISPDDL